MLIALPTNGTLLNKDILSFFKKHNVRLSISIGGAREFHNLNKTFIDRRESFNVIVKKAFLAQKIIGPERLSVLMTVTPDLGYKLFDNFRSIINNKLGFKIIHIDPVHGVKWSGK